MTKNKRTKSAENRERQSKVIREAAHVFPKSYTALMMGMFPGKYNTEYMKTRLFNVFNSRVYDEDIIKDIEMATKTLIVFTTKNQKSNGR